MLTAVSLVSHPAASVSPCIHCTWTQCLAATAGFLIQMRGTTRTSLGSISPDVSLSRAKKPQRVPKGSATQKWVFTRTINHKYWDKARTGVPTMEPAMIINSHGIINRANAGVTIDENRLFHQVLIAAGPTTKQRSTIVKHQLQEFIMFS